MQIILLFSLVNIVEIYKLLVGSKKKKVEFCTDLLPLTLPLHMEAKLRPLSF